MAITGIIFRPMRLQAEFAGLTVADWSNRRCGCFKALHVHIRGRYFLLFMKVKNKVRFCHTDECHHQHDKLAISKWKKIPFYLQLKNIIGDTACIKINAESRLYSCYQIICSISSGPPWWQMVSFSGNLWQPPHLSADDRSHFTNALMTASCFIQCPWCSPQLSSAAVEVDGLWEESSVECESVSWYQQL